MTVMQASEHREALQKLVRVLGGRVCGARTAQLCIVCGGATVPRELPGKAVAVREEWLLQLAEGYALPEKEGWLVPR
jgi:hypothetical protein